MPNVDPSRSKILRERFEREFIRRYKKLRRDVIDKVDTEDSFGLKAINNTVWKPLSQDKQVKEFEKWLSTQVKGTVENGNYWTPYIKESYEKGTSRMYRDVNKSQLATDAVGLDSSTKQFIKFSLTRPETVAKVKMMAGRVFTDLQGVNSAMSTQMSRVLVEGMSRGDSPRLMAKNMADRVDKIGITRARMIARTEVIRVHAEGQLDTLESLGLDKVQIMVEWTTSASPCPLCSDMSGAVFKVKEARGLIPRHPNCVCVFIPANLGESPRGQQRGQKKVRKAVDRSLKSERPKSKKNQSIDADRRASRWAGSQVRITKRKRRTK